MVVCLDAFALASTEVVRVPGRRGACNLSRLLPLTFQIAKVGLDNIYYRTSYE